MHWFGGSIAEAVTLSKQRNAIFVVFVEGENELSVEMAATIDDTAVVTRLSDQANFLAVKLKSGSTNYTHFAQIYQFVPVPSLFFIGRNGTPLEVVCAGVQASNLATRIDRILEEHHKENKPIQPSTSAQNIREQTVNFLQSEAASPVRDETEKTEKTTEKTAEKKHAESEPESSATPAKQAKTDESPDHEIVCDGGVCVRRPKNKPDEPGPSQAPTPTMPVAPDNTQGEVPMESESAGSIDDKMERAKELIEARRREKADKEKEADKQKEMDRRATGKGVAELKRWQADQELKQIQEERKREKMENNLARQRILEQIAQDRAERRARDLPPATPTAPANTATAQTPPATSGDSGGRARIQFKLPDGTSHTAHFDAEDTLANVQRYVADNLQLSTSSFSLWTAFPRRELTESTASLRGLQLAPSAALLVLPRRAAPTVATPQPVASIFAFLTQLFTSLILEPTHQLYMWLRTRLFPPPAAAPRASSPTVPPPPPPGNLRRRGNIHRLPSDRTGDDDNNTWNGNSTQQM
ncbi:UBX domain-containing protein 4 [Anticarsia gemmatalis]|uniref:UBX domain-containing protein 4 n=1 Tax=Anticarsia gemmatalis TaxID=129554 RepID=UPI003F766504